MVVTEAVAAEETRPVTTVTSLAILPETALTLPVKEAAMMEATAEVADAVGPSVTTVSESSLVGVRVIVT